MTLSGRLFVNQKKSPEAQKFTFFEIFFAVAHLLIKTKLFYFYQNFISSAVQRFHGGTKKRYKQQTTNNERTPQTIIRPRQDSQNPRANTLFIYGQLYFKIGPQVVIFEDKIGCL